MPVLFHICLLFSDRPPPSPSPLSARSFHVAPFITDCIPGTALSSCYTLLRFLPIIVAAMAANGIPLHCNICPKKPNFSDVSHLLTHIASKGHLSNYYKVKVRSGTEDASRKLIDTYDRWYADWNVEELMSDRMSQKDKRRARPRSSATGMVLLSPWTKARLSTDKLRSQPALQVFQSLKHLSPAPAVPAQR